MNALQEIVWIEIVGPLWFERNDIKHENAGVNDEREAETLNNRIRWFIQHQYTVLSYGDRFLTGTDVSMLPTMRLATKKRWLRKLEIVCELYEREQKQTGGGQKRTTHYFRPQMGGESTVTDRRDLGVDPG